MYADCEDCGLELTTNEKIRAALSKRDPTYNFDDVDFDCFTE